jgi:hypothetical protein
LYKKELVGSCIHALCCTLFNRHSDMRSLNSELVCDSKMCFVSIGTCSVLAVCQKRT